MMQSYIKEKYLIHYFNALINSERYSDEDKNRQAILEYFKCKTNIVLDSDFSSVLNQIEQAYKPIVSTFINSLTTGRNGTSIKTNQVNLFRLLKRKEFYSKLKEPFASFWLDKETMKYNSEKYEEVNPFNFLSTENDLIKWKSFSKQNDYYISSIADRNSPNTFSRNTFKDYARCYKDLILSDHYAFMDKIGIEENIIPYITSLSSNINMIQNILIFTEKEKIYNESLKDTYLLIKKLLKNQGIKANLIIYTSHKIPHGRYLITNNNFIEFTNSMDLFNKEGDLKSKKKLNDCTIKILPIFNADKSFVLDILLNALKNIIEDSEKDNYRIEHYGEKSINILDLI